MVVVGITVIVAAIILMAVGGAKKGKVRGVAVIMIGPIPIIFGSGKKSVKVVALALALTVVVLIIIVLKVGVDV